MTNVTEHDATLHAEINPNGAYTAYEFQIYTAPSFNYTQMACPLSVPGYFQCTTIIVGEPLPPGLVEPQQSSILGGFGDQLVSLDLASTGSSLQPGTTYYYRVIASNGGEVVYGQTQSFMTGPNPVYQPSIGSESASNISQTDATLEAQINPQSLEDGAYYQFQVVADTSEYLPEFACPTEGFPANSSLCLGLTSQAGALPIEGIPAAVQDQSVSLDLASAGMSLQPGTTYHYRVITARSVQTVDTINWEDPIVHGPDQTLTTLSQVVPPVTEGESETAKTTPTDNPAGGSQAVIAVPTLSFPSRGGHGPKRVGHCSGNLRDPRRRRRSRKGCTSIGMRRSQAGDALPAHLP